MSEQRPCQVKGCCRLTVFDQTNRVDDVALRERMTAIAHERRRLGVSAYARAAAVRRSSVNHKRLVCMYRKEKAGCAPPAVVADAPPCSQPALVARLFVSDQMTDCRRFGVWTGVDDCTRDCLALVANTSPTGPLVARELETLMASRSKPEMIISENGTEFTSNAILAFADRAGTVSNFVCGGADFILRPHGRYEAFAEDDGELCLGH